MSKVVSPLTGFLFPTIEDELEKYDISPDIVEKIGTDKNIRIREHDSMLTYLHIGLTNPIVAYRSYKNRKSNAGFTRPDFEAGPHKYVTIAKELSPILRAAEVSEKQQRLLLLFHEARHLSEENKKLNRFMKEVDAEYESAKLTAEVTNDPDFLRNYIYYRTITQMNNDNGYDFALYAKSKMAGEKPPTKEEMLQAKENLLNMLAQHCVVIGDETDKFTRQKAEIFKEATKFYQEYLDMSINGKDITEVPYVQSSSECTPSKAKPTAIKMPQA